MSELTQQKIDEAILRTANRLVKDKGNGDINILFKGQFDCHSGNVILDFTKVNDNKIRACYCCYDKMYHSTFNTNQLTP